MFHKVSSLFVQFILLIFLMHYAYISDDQFLDRLIGVGRGGGGCYVYVYFLINPWAFYFLLPWA